jgi:8-oxo-dGTP diphosphatase
VSVRVVGVALLREVDGVEHLLTARRIEPEHLAGGWELPGGKVDPGETEIEALHREVHEELGVAVVLTGTIAGPLDGLWPLGEDYELRVFTARLADPAAEPRPLEQHDALAWVPLAEWDQVEWLDGDRGPVAAVAELHAS